MIDELDEAIRQLFIRELPIKNSEVDIAFDQPKKEWSARLSRPTVNIFLHDVRENVRLRQAQLQRRVERTNEGAGVQRRNYVRLDLHYLITVWATEPEDEHRLLARALLVLFRNQELPLALVPEGLKDQPEPIPITIAQYEIVEKPSDIWNVLDNQQRPAIMMVATLALDPHEPITAPLVRTRELRFGQAAEPAVSQQITESDRSNGYWTIGGTIRSKTPLNKVSITVIESGQLANLQAEGRFAIGNLRAGDYTLEIAAEGRKPSRHKITVPSPDYDFDL
ncbi:MAG TPA: Pvc16 family protein [Anaerolineales bacterium]|nr:Pvc16 family protein [Anaerolineales bacterium]